MTLDTTSYLGNRNLKAAGVAFEWTPEQQMEYFRCAEDPVYFIKNYMTIISLDRGKIKFDLWKFQSEMITKMVENRFVIAKMPRQVGKSVTVAGLLLWYVLFTEDFRIAVLAHKAKGAARILQMVKLAYERIPKWMQQGVEEWNKGNIALDNGSSIEAFSTSADSVRGGTYNLVYLDEFAFVPPNMQEDFMTGTYPVISSSQTAKIIITSTPKGFNWFWKIWVQSEEGKNSYVRHSVHWSDVPGRDEKWKEETIRNTSQSQFDQEFECEFLGSSGTLINGKKLGMLVFVDPGKAGEEGWKVYKDPISDHSYVLVADTSRGGGGDYQAFIIVDTTEYPYEIVATFRNNEMSHLVYPQYIYQFAKTYNEAFVLVETNDIGQVVSDILYDEFEYENLFLTQTKGRAGQQVGGAWGGVRPTFGVRTTTPVKRIGCVNLKSLIENDKLIINDEQFLYELQRFIQVRNSFEAEEGCNDDMVMCGVLFAWLVHQDYFKDITSSDIRKTMKADNEHIINESLVPFGFITTGQEDYEMDEQGWTPADDPKWSWMGEL